MNMTRRGQGKESEMTGLGEVTGTGTQSQNS